MARTDRIPHRVTPPRRARRFGAFLGLWLLGTASVALGWPWTRDMWRQPTFKIQERPFLPPPGSVPVRGRERPMKRCAADGVLTSPIPLTEASAREGKKRFQAQCAVCHGVTADGEGTVASIFYPPPPGLNNSYYRRVTDGYLYETIRGGGFRMPGYAEALGARERWQVIHYLRKIQGTGLVPGGPGADTILPSPCMDLGLLRVEEARPR